MKGVLKAQVMTKGHTLRQVMIVVSSLLGCFTGLTSYQ
jgi:hypothetical protein